MDASVASVRETANMLVKLVFASKVSKVAGEVQAQNELIRALIQQQAAAAIAQAVHSYGADL